MKDVKLLEHYISTLKSEFSSSYVRNAHLYEVLPKNSQITQNLSQKDLDALHKFVKSNPMYENSYESVYADTQCIVYEGDMSSYWLDSIKHDTSYAPFYPTWILSAYALSKAAVKLGAKYAVDIGSGDGRIAYCTQMAGIDTCSVEIDKNLISLQKKICAKTNIHFDIKCDDATQIEYSELDRVIFFIGGLPEVGEMLVRRVIEKTIHAIKPIYVLAGTLAPRKTSRDSTTYGWGQMMEEFGLVQLETLVLPTRWTVEQTENTPYIFTVKKD
ncbi:MAG: hypothetical protein K8823_1435 [Cenarchaeum symbiont of Oopsacas minuta]|nr:hypothetical protein [Cenarchaeum symbiont of Oopsacas minuta]